MLIGYCAKKTSVQRAFLVATVSALLLTALCALLKFSLGSEALPTPTVSSMSHEAP